MAGPGRRPYVEELDAVHRAICCPSKCSHDRGALFHCRRRREAGVALIAVLWIVVLLSVLAASFNTSTKMMAENERPRRADGSIYAFALAEGEVRVSVQNEGGRIDLNGAPDELLQALFVSAGLEERSAARLTEAIEDFRDTNDERRAAGGAEDQDYFDAGFSYGAKDAPFQAVEELQRVVGMTPELYARVAPALTVHSEEDVIDFRRAPREVLAAVAALTDVDIEELLLALDRPEDDPDTLLELDEAEGYFEELDLSIYAIRSVARTAGGGRFLRKAVVQIAPDEEPRFLVRRWTEGGVLRRRTVDWD